MTFPKWLNPQISIGNILTVLSVAVALVVGWVEMTGAVRDVALEQNRLNARVSVVENRFDDMLTSLHSDRVANTRALAEMGADIRYMRQAVDELRSR